MWHFHLIWKLQIPPCLPGNLVLEAMGISTHLFCSGLFLILRKRLFALIIYILYPSLSVEAFRKTQKLSLLRTSFYLWLLKLTVLSTLRTLHWAFNFKCFNWLLLKLISFVFQLGIFFIPLWDIIRYNTRKRYCHCYYCCWTWSSQTSNLSTVLLYVLETKSKVFHIMVFLIVI